MPEVIATLENIEKFQNNIISYNIKNNASNIKDPFLLLYQSWRLDIKLLFKEKMELIVKWQF